MSTRLADLLEDAAARHRLPPALVLSMAHVESSLDPWATRTEPAYRWLWNVRAQRPYRASGTQAAAKLPPADFPAPRGISTLTEWIAQQTSWGLLQVMGANAREMGLEGHLSQLCDPATGAEYGCRFLARLARTHKGGHGWRGVVQAFNTGTPTSRNDYPDKVASMGRALDIPDLFDALETA